VDRIDHGTNIVENRELVTLVRERRLGLTCCPVSNSFVTADMKAAEMVALLKSGVLVTVNSDDPAYFGAYIADNYLALADTAGLGTAELVALAKNSFEAAWLPESEKQAYLRSIENYVAGYVTG
jgi:adenosine deaminase